MQMGLDRPHREHELVGNLLGALLQKDEADDLALAPTHAVGVAEARQPEVDVRLKELTVFSGRGARVLGGVLREDAHEFARVHNLTDGTADHDHVLGEVALGDVPEELVGNGSDFRRGSINHDEEGVLEEHDYREDADKLVEALGAQGVGTLVLGRAAHGVPAGVGQRANEGEVAGTPVEIVAQRV